VDAGRVLVGGGFGSYAFYAFDAESGELAWQRQTGDDGPTAAVASEGCVVFNTESCTVYVLDAATGATRWERWLGDPLLAQPAVGGGRVFMAWPAKGKHVLGAFDLREGTPLWQAALPGDVISAPVHAEGAVYVSTFEGTVSCFDAETGRPLWSDDMRATSAPWVWKGHAYVSQRDPDAPAPEPREYVTRTRGMARRKMSPSKRAAYLRTSRGTPSFAAEQAADAGVGFGTPPASAKLHQAEQLLGTPSISRAWAYQGSRPCVWNDVLYTVVGEELSAHRLDDGSELWSWQAPGSDDLERAITPPAVTNGRVYVGTRDGRVCCFDAATGSPRWEHAVAAPLSWQPVVARGWVYCGAPDGRLVALHTGDPGDDGWPMWGGGPGHCGPAS
jgi:Ca-activated chloride channel family protein